MAKTAPIAKSDRKWEIEDAARTLMRAEEIKKNKELFISARRELKKQASAINRVVGAVRGS